MKNAISNNTIIGVDLELQYHLATDASDLALGGCLFQLYGTQAGTEATPIFFSLLFSTLLDLNGSP